MVRCVLKHTTTLFALSNHYILSREWRVIVHQVQTNYHGGPIWSYNQSGVTKRDTHIVVGCVLSQLKPTELYFS